MKKKPKQKAGAPAFAPMMPGGLRSAIQEAERLWKRGAMQDAIALMVDATNDFPERIEGFRALWEFAAGSGDRFAAVLGAEGMLRLQPDDSESIFIAAQAYEEAGLVFHAWKHMVRLLDEHRDKFDPSMQDGVDLNRKMIRETALERFGGTDAEQAIEYGLLEEVGQLEQVRGNEYAARQAILKLVAAVPDYAPAHQELAEIHFHAGEDEPALAEIDKAIALDPTRADYHATKVEMLHGLDAEAEALAAAQPLKTLTLRDPFEARFAGLALWLVGEEEALIDLPARTPAPDDDDEEPVKVAYSDVHHMAATAAAADGRAEEEVEALLAKATYEPSDVLQSMEESTDWDEDFDDELDEDEDDGA